MPQIEFPIDVKAIDYKDSPAWRPKALFGGECGDFVAVRPCGEEHDKKTYLELLLGELPLSLECRLDPASGTLTISRAIYNPAIFVPELYTIVFGAGSWWRKIKNAEQLGEITDAAIESVWYVKTLERMQAKQADGEAA